jgi:hypothetical protein
LPDAGLAGGLGDGRVLFAMDAWLRPAAIHVQMDERLGREGIRLDRPERRQSLDGSAGRLLRAEIAYGPPLKLRNVTIYKLDAEGHLAEVDTAVLARPWTKDAGCWKTDNSWHAKRRRPGNVLSTARQAKTQRPFRPQTLPWCWTNCGCAISACRRNI